MTNLTGRLPHEDSHTLIEQEQTSPYYVVQSVPRLKDNVEFDGYTTWVHRQTFIPVQVHYQKKDLVYRAIKVLEVRDIQGKKTVTRIEVRHDNHPLAFDESDPRSEMNFVSVEYDYGLTEEIFSERYLRVPPEMVRE